MDKLIFSGKVISIQPRIRLTRSFDEASHSYLGYAIKLAGTVDADERDFSIGIGKSAQAKFNFKVNDIISGECLPVPDPDMEPVDYYKVSKLAKVEEGEQGSISAPWELVPPELEVYRERGHRRLAARTYVRFGEGSVQTCYGNTARRHFPTLLAHHFAGQSVHPDPQSQEQRG